MTELLLNEQTKKDFDRFIAKPTHAVIIEGKPGAGKRSFGDHIAAQTLGQSDSTIRSYQYYLAIKPDNLSISTVIRSGILILLERQFL